MRKTLSVKPGTSDGYMFTINQVREVWGQRADAQMHA